MACDYVAFIFVLKYTDQFGNNFDKNPGIHKKRIQDWKTRRRKDLRRTNDPPIIKKIARRITGSGSRISCRNRIQNFTILASGPVQSTLLEKIANVIGKNTKFKQDPT